MSLDKPDNPIGDQIRSAREARGWSQVDLAKALSVSSRTVGEWERGGRPPKKHIGLIEKILGVTLRVTHTELAAFPDSHMASELHSRLVDRRHRIAHLEKRVAALEKQLRDAGIDPAPDTDGGEES